MTNFGNSPLTRTGLFVVVMAGLISSTCLASHPYHVSRAEVNWNQKSGNFEVALCVWPADLEKAIKIQEGKSVDLDKVKSLDKLLQRYVQNRFVVRTHSARDSDDATSLETIRWIGHEKTIKEAWLYFEVPGGKSPAQWIIENRVFFELNDDQLNQIQIDAGAESKTFICAKSAASHPFETRVKNKKSR